MLISLVLYLAHAGSHAVCCATKKEAQRTFKLKLGSTCKTGMLKSSHGLQVNDVCCCSESELMSRGFCTAAKLDTMAQYCSYAGRWLDLSQFGGEEGDMFTFFLLHPEKRTENGKVEYKVPGKKPKECVEFMKTSSIGGWLAESVESSKCLPDGSSCDFVGAVKISGTNECKCPAYTLPVISSSVESFRAIWQRGGGNGLPGDAWNKDRLSQFLAFPGSGQQTKGFTIREANDNQLYCNSVREGDLPRPLTCADVRAVPYHDPKTSAVVPGVCSCGRSACGGPMCGRDLNNQVYHGQNFFPLQFAFLKFSQYHHTSGLQSSTTCHPTCPDYGGDPAPIFSSGAMDACYCAGACHGCTGEQTVNGKKVGLFNVFDAMAGKASCVPATGSGYGSGGYTGGPSGDGHTGGSAPRSAPGGSPPRSDSKPATGRRHRHKKKSSKLLRLLNNPERYGKYRTSRRATTELLEMCKENPEMLLVRKNVLKLLQKWHTDKAVASGVIEDEEGMPVALAVTKFLVKVKGRYDDDKDGQRPGALRACFERVGCKTVVCADHLASVEKPEERVEACSRTGPHGEESFNDYC